MSVKNCCRTRKRTERRKGGKNRNKKNNKDGKKTGTVRKAQDRSQKKSSLSKHIASQSSEASSCPATSPHFSVIPPPALGSAIPTYCLCFSSMFVSTTQQFLGEGIITGSWQLLSLQNPCPHPLSS